MGTAEADRPQTDGMERDVPLVTRKDYSQGQRRWPNKWRWPLGLGCTAVFIIGMSLLYWYAVPDRSLAKTMAVPISGNLAPSSPHPSASTVRVLVDARLETVMIEFLPESGQTMGSPSSAPNAQGGAARCAVAPSSGAVPICTVDVPADARPAADVPTTASDSTVGRWGTCPCGRGSAMSVLSR
jgi:hypothetical protein